MADLRTRRYFGEAGTVDVPTACGGHRGGAMRRVLEPVLAVTAGTVPSAVPRRTGRPPSRFHVPPVGDGALERTRLLARVSTAVQGPLTLVSAAAGSGKTSLLAAWAARRQSPGPLLWMTVEDEDSRPDVFWSGLVDGLARADPSLAGLDLDDPARPVDRALLDALVWRLTEQDAPWVVVLDDAHHLTDRQVGEDLAYLLRACEGHLRLVLLTRVDPPLPLHRYRLDGDVAELRQEDLAFTGAEVGELLRTCGVEPSEAATRRLLERTAGWVAGVRFAARALQGHPGRQPAGLDAPGGEDGLVAYLEAEVLDRQPADLRAAMLRCAVVDALEPGLAEALAGGTDGDRLLERLLAGGTLLAPGGDGDGRAVLRFQPQLRDLARARLADEGPDALPAAHRRAARWYADRGRLGECVEHAARAGAWELAATSAVDGLAVVTSLAGTTDEGLSLLGRMMPDDVDGLPAALVRASRAVHDGDAAALSAELGRARAGLAADSPGLHARLLTLAVLEATSAVRVGDEVTASGALSTGERLLRRLPSQPPDRRAQAAALLTVLRCERDLLRGDLPGVLRGATDPRLGPELLDHLPGVLLTRVRAATALARCLTGQLRRGGSCARLVLGPAPHAVGSRPASPTDAPTDAATDRCLARASLALAWAATEAYDVDAAQAHAAAAEQRGAGEDRVDATVLALVRARVLRAHGDQASATEVLRAVRASGRALPPAWDARVLGALSSSETDARPGAIAQGAGTGGGSATGSAVPGAAVDPLTLGVRLELLVQRAARAEQAGDRDRALALLDRALRLGEPERMRRPFVESPVAVRRLLRTSGTLPTGWLSTSQDPGRTAREREASVSAGGVVREGTGAGGHGWHGASAGAESGDRAGGHSPRVAVVVAASDGSYERLTAKELEVLGHLADLLSTVEVAAVMYVSVNTVRTHVRSILRKLDVARRHEAVRRAWELGLLTSGSQAGAGRRAAVPPGTVGVSGAEDA